MTDTIYLYFLPYLIDRSTHHIPENYKFKFDENIMASQMNFYSLQTPCYEFVSSANLKRLCKSIGKE